MTAVLAVRLDSDGDVLLTGPALRALGHLGPVDLLVSPAGRRASDLLPGVRSILVFDPPWSGLSPVPVDPSAVADLMERVAAGHYDRAVVFTSFHQSPLPMALVLRLAGVPFVAATSEDYPGTLLDVRHRRPDGLHEVEAALDLAVAAGGSPAPGDEGRLAVRHPLPDVEPLVPRSRYVVVHPGASVPSRAPSPDQARAIVAGLTAAGRAVLVTGGPDERDLTAAVAGRAGVDLGGRTSLAELAAVLSGAEVVVVGNTGPAHLAAAVGTPVVSLFSPVVPARRWAPFGVPSIVLGDQGAACVGTRARECPLPGHPCLTSVTPEQVRAAVDALATAVPEEVVA
ncbi:glycosyltransferase family 9 protein [Cellulomonas fengjieae]|uniref:Glycosyltransferase family 9 protein n=1 Tax=Cellulomonas fengjieae TaxID=2819978 RepID=A0ABS3SJU8_9CELL|nr:glycosyltransferase family 9 protein [Cellulomonas fengjieae]MBO3085769.1 glycosyltransferase family 9 protein [Cellulomonas fengjieae]QVI67524.1 glycosyltransferase family 9 protein [Cellulomonas fengjieae]